MRTTAGIHHVTAIAADAQRNVDFYMRVLGLRLVKRSVNQDDPTTYHLYYGDETGSPGTILTFFPWQGMRRGRIGTGQAAATAFAIAPAALGWWVERLVGHGIAFRGPEHRFDEQVLRFHDPDGLALELVTDPRATAPGWGEGTVPTEHAIRGFFGVTLWVAEGAPTGGVLSEVLGYREVAREGMVTRYRAGTEGRGLGIGDGGPGAVVDLVTSSGFPRGLQGAGTVHHVAFRAADDAAEAELRAQVVAGGMHPTGVVERFYFRSVYFHEPGGVLFELATDAPGFTVDEPPAELGRGIKLPPWFEEHRTAIEAALPPLDLDAVGAR
jgi:glyoxalase family protein